MTAYVIPNAILITTPRTKYTFASFLARDTVYDVIHNIWRLARPTDESVEGPLAIEEGAPGGAPEGAGGPAVMLHKSTQCACSKSGQHYSEIAMDTVLPGTPERIYNLLFASGFIKDFMRVDQKLEGIRLSMVDLFPPLKHKPHRHPDLGLDAVGGGAQVPHTQHVVHQAPQREHRPALDEVRTARRDGVL